MKLKVFRYHEGMDSPRYDTFELEPNPGMTILEALFQIQEHFDDSIAFRYSCRGAVCGTCAMLINKVPRLACRTQVTSILKGDIKTDFSPDATIGENVLRNSDEEILIEPLPHLPVIKDLMVDTTTFFQNYKFVDPVLRPSDPTPEKERLMDRQRCKNLNYILTAFSVPPVSEHALLMGKIQNIWDLLL